MQLFCILLSSMVAAAMSVPIACAPSIVEQIISDPTDTFGCDGTQSRVDNMTWWIETGGADRFLSFKTPPCTIGSWHYVTIFQGDTVLVPMTQRCDRVAPTKPLVAGGPGPVAVRWATLGGAKLAEKPLFTLTVSQPTDPRHFQVVAGVERELPAVTASTVLTHMTMSMTFGAFLSYNVTVVDYTGTREPVMMLSNNYQPQSSDYQYANKSVCAASRCHLRLTVPNPPNGLWFASLVTFGAASKIIVTPTWTFTVPSLQNAAVVDKNPGPDAVYQLYVPSGAAQLTVTLQTTGGTGSSLLYIAQGVVPHTKSAGWILDSSSAPAQVTIPNPHVATGPNPGLYLLRMTGSTKARMTVNYT